MAPIQRQKKRLKKIIFKKKLTLEYGEDLSAFSSPEWTASDEDSLEIKAAGNKTENLINI